MAIWAQDRDGVLGLVGVDTDIYKPLGYSRSHTYFTSVNSDEGGRYEDRKISIIYRSYILLPLRIWKLVDDGQSRLQRV